MEKWVAALLLSSLFLGCVDETNAFPVVENKDRAWIFCAMQGFAERQWLTYNSMTTYSIRGKFQSQMNICNSGVNYAVWLSTFKPDSEKVTDLYAKCNAQLPGSIAMASLCKGDWVPLLDDYNQILPSRIQGDAVRFTDDDPYQNRKFEGTSFFYTTYRRREPRDLLGAFCNRDPW